MQTRILLLNFLRTMILPERRYSKLCYKVNTDDEGVQLVRNLIQDKLR
jgi:hypothetical protein